MTTNILNQASVCYRSNNTQVCARSNVASVQRQGSLSVTKTSLSRTHRQGDEITFTHSVTNNCSACMYNVEIVDDLGTYDYRPSPSLPVRSLTPLSYVGPSHLYLDGVFQRELTPELEDDQLSYVLDSLTPGQTAMIIHLLQVNEFAPNDDITNTIEVSVAAGCEPVQDSCTLAPEEYARLCILKSMSPDPVQDGDDITYNFVLYNYGNLPATNVVLTDEFDPAPAGPLTVRVDGELVDEEDYSYANGVLTLPGSGSSFTLTVPAGTQVRDGAGRCSIDPGVLRVSVTGKLAVPCCARQRRCVSTVQRAR